MSWVEAQAAPVLPLVPGGIMKGECEALVTTVYSCCIKGLAQLTDFSFSLLFNSRLMLAYELHVRGGEHAELGKPRDSFVSPTTIKKTVRGRGCQTVQKIMQLPTR